MYLEAWQPGQLRVTSMVVACTAETGHGHLPGTTCKCFLRLMHKEVGDCHMTAGRSGMATGLASSRTHQYMVLTPAPGALYFKPPSTATFQVLLGVVAVSTGVPQP